MQIKIPDEGVAGLVQQAEQSLDRAHDESNGVAIEGDIAGPDVRRGEG